MRCIILESPFRGKDWAETSRFANYRRTAIRDAITRGESPYASHVIIPGALDDNNPEERKKGIEAGYAWWEHAAAIVFYLDHGMSEGMKLAYDRAEYLEMKIERRTINTKQDTAAQWDGIL